MRLIAVRPNNDKLRHTKCTLTQELHSLCCFRAHMSRFDVLVAPFRIRCGGECYMVNRRVGARNEASVKDGGLSRSRGSWDGIIGLMVDVRESSILFHREGSVSLGICLRHDTFNIYVWAPLRIMARFANKWNMKFYVVFL